MRRLPARPAGAEAVRPWRSNSVATGSPTFTTSELTRRTRKTPVSFLTGAVSVPAAAARRRARRSGRAGPRRRYRRRPARRFRSSCARGQIERNPHVAGGVGLGRSRFGGVDDQFDGGADGARLTISVWAAAGPLPAVRTSAAATDSGRKGFIIQRLSVSISQPKQLLCVAVQQLALDRRARGEAPDGGDGLRSLAPRAAAVVDRCSRCRTAAWPDGARGSRA